MFSTEKKKKKVILYVFGTWMYEYGELYVTCYVISQKDFVRIAHVF